MDWNSLSLYFTTLFFFLYSFFSIIWKKQSHFIFYPIKLSILKVPVLFPFQRSSADSMEDALSVVVEIKMVVPLSRHILLYASWKPKKALEIPNKRKKDKENGGINRMRFSKRSICIPKMCYPTKHNTLIVIISKFAYHYINMNYWIYGHIFKLFQA